MELETPPYGKPFIFQLVLLALVTLGLQVGLMFLLPDVSWNIGRTTMPVARGPMGVSSGTMVSPGNSAVWNDELWIAVFTGSPAMPGGKSARGPTARFLALDLKSGKSRETDISISPSPCGLLVLDDNLWSVAENVVHRIQDGQTFPRYPRRGLIEPTKPFNYEGQLAVIDKKKNDVYTLLTWKDNEWNEVGQIEAPASAAAARWYTPELRVVTDGKKTFLFFSDGQTISYREGIEFVSEAAPVSALSPENQILPLALRSNPQSPALNIMPGWKHTPIITNWGVWDVAIANDEIYAYSCSIYGSTDLQQYKYQAGAWINISPSSAIRSSSVTVASGSPGYVVTDDLRLYSIGSDRNLQHLTAGIKLTEKFQYAMFILQLFSRYFIAMGVLCLGTWRLMSVYRTPQYVYGKRHVIQASILRRGIARTIDTTATVFPAAFWFTVAVDSHSDQFYSYSPANGINVFTFMIFSVFGMWLGSTLALSFIEGCWGITPGKWLCGIRTLRTTLRPCGMLRALARELMVYVDSLFLLTWIPGVLLIALTKDWQRAGDLASDTVVVMAQRAETPPK